MITVEDRGDELYVVDAEKNELTIRVEGWEPGGEPREIDRRVDKTIAGKVSEIRFPDSGVCIESESEDQWALLRDEIGEHEIGNGDQIVQAETNITTFVRFQGSAIVSRINRGHDVVLSFNEKTTVTIGFRAGVELPIGTITVPPTPKGIGTSVSIMSAAIETTKPDKSFPSLRRHPPLIDFGEEYTVPEKIRKAIPDTDIQLHVPNDLASILVASPLAYYLQASIEICLKDDHCVTIPSIGIEHPLDPLPGLQADVADLLHRCFYLDCLVRNSGPYGLDLPTYELLDEIGLDGSYLYDASPGERLATYLDAPYSKIKSEFLDWHLSTFVDPEVSYAPALPHLLDRLSLIFLPDAAILNSNELVEQSLSETYRSQKIPRSNETANNSRLLKPASRRGQVHGWMADGAPVDAFKALPIAFENRHDFIDNDIVEKKITVVLNDHGMTQEQKCVQRIYRERAANLSINVEIRQDLSTQELIDVFEQPKDFVHYIGHCDGEGLRCSNGQLPISSINKSNVRTFLLNACNSYKEGVELIKKGSIAGGVTLKRVLDQQAAQVGSAFSRLVIYGYSISHALNLARRQAVVSKGYTTVGDGTFVLSQANTNFPKYYKLSKESGGKYTLLMDVLTHCNPGAAYKPYTEDTRVYLSGEMATFQLTKSELRDFLELEVSPIIYKGQLFWTDELYEEL